MLSGAGRSQRHQANGRTGKGPARRCSGARRWRRRWITRAGCRKILVFPDGRALQLAAALSVGGASMSRFRCCLLVLASGLWGAAAVVSEAAPRAASAADGALTAIVGATVVHPQLDGAAARSTDRTVIIAGNRIKAVVPAATTQVPRGARVIDCHGKSVLPGLIESHVHIFQSGN